jgi:tetratricopeptide (TPR) repeat protein
MMSKDALPNYPTMQKTSFLDLILDLKLDITKKHSSWEKCVYYSFENQGKDFNKLPYTLGQTLELGIIDEISLYTKISAENLETLHYQSDGPIVLLQDMLIHSHSLTPIQQLNFCYALTAIARYATASDLFKKIPFDALNPREKLYYYFLSITLFQTFEINEEVTKSANEIKTLLQSFSFNDNDIIASAALSIISFAKNFFGNKEIISWFIQYAEKPIERLMHSSETKDLAILSGYYRAFAMLPASQKNKIATCEAMSTARHYAASITPQSPLEHAVKDYYLRSCYQSWVKEHLYIYQDVEQAQKYADQLIDFDAYWSISYIEAAECYLQGKNYQQALALYQHAKTLGLPRLVYSQYMVAYCHELLEQIDSALTEYKNTLALDAGNVSAAVNGFLLAKKHRHTLKTYFNAYIVEWDSQGVLPAAAKELLKEKD